jgi:DNA-binding response OmpR family regulator
MEAVREARRDLENPNAAAGPKATPRSLFVVERDARLQDAMRDHFRQLGFRVFVASDPGFALDRFQMKAYDALVLDAGSTGDEGRYVFERVMREAEMKEKTLAAILILSEEQAGWAKDIPPHSHAAVLVRPLTLKQLERSLRNLLPDSEKNGDGPDK